MNILIFSTAMFVLFQYMHVPARLANSRLVRSMSESTFFVYMVHLFFVEKLNLLGIRTIAYPVIWSVPVMAVSIFIVSMFLGWAVGKIPVIGKIVTFQ